MVMLADVPATALPDYRLTINQYMLFDLNIPAVLASVYMAYYFILEPIAAVRPMLHPNYSWLIYSQFLYVPVMTTTLLTATAYAKQPDHLSNAAIIHAVCWIAQFIGHGVAEGRAPALLDNLLGAVVLAPFFVHLEVLFNLGYRPDMHKRLTNDISKEVVKIRKIQGDKKRAQSAKDL